MKPIQFALSFLSFNAGKKENKIQNGILGMPLKLNEWRFGAAQPAGNALAKKERANKPIQ